MNLVAHHDAGLSFLERAASGTPRGLLLLLHGVGADERSLLAVAAEQADDITVQLLRAPLTLGPGQHAWFQVRFTAQGPVIQPEQAEASRRLLVDFIAAQQRRVGLAPARTLVAGFSQGGIMSAGVALTAPASVAGFGLLSGRILPEIAPLIPADLGRHPLHGLVTHGRRDSKLPYALAEQSVARLRALGVAHELRGYDQDHALDAAMRTDLRAWIEQRLAG